MNKSRHDNEQKLNKTIPPRLSLIVINDNDNVVINSELIITNHH